MSYVDDLLFWSNDEAHIHKMGILLHQAGIAFEQEDGAAGFLGVRIEQSKSVLLEKKQKGLINHVFKALEFDVHTANGKATAPKTKPFAKDTDGEVAQSNFSYSSFVGMLLYLSGQS